MDSNVVAGTSLGLRIVTFICLLISLVVTATNKLALIDGTKVTYNDVHGYRYVLSVAIIGLTYALLQMGFSIYNMVTKNILIWDGLPVFNYYADQVITWVFASGVGAGFAVTVELQRIVDQAIKNAAGEEGLLIPAVDEQKSIIDDFFNKGNIGTGMLFVAFISMAILVFLSSFNRTKAVETKAVETQDTEAQAVQTQAVETPSIN